MEALLALKVLKADRVLRALPEIMVVRELQEPMPGRELLVFKAI
jgi:hypothetical protein